MVPWKFLDVTWRFKDLNPKGFLCIIPIKSKNPRVLYFNTLCFSVAYIGEQGFISSDSSARYQFSSVQPLSHVLFFATLWTAARQASLSITNAWNLLRLMSTEFVMPSNHLILCLPLLLPPSESFPASESFQMSQLSASGDQSIGVSASISVLPMNSQDWSPLGWTGWISLQSYPNKTKTLIRKYSWTPSFTAALFTIIKIRKQPKRSSTDEWIKMMWHIYLMEY